MKGRGLRSLNTLKYSMLHAIEMYLIVCMVKKIIVWVWIWSLYLNQLQLITREVHWQSPEGYFSWNTSDTNY